MEIIVNNEPLRIEGDAAIDISDINPLTGKPLGEPFFLCDVAENEEEE